MIQPDLDDVLAAIIDTFDRYLVPEIHEEYAASHAVRSYLQHQLRRQEPWLVHAFTGPRR